MADLDITVNLQDVERLKEILGNLAPLYGKTVARIDRENKLLERSTKASMQTMITALNEVVGAKAQNDLAKWSASFRQRISLMEKSEKLAERQAAAEAKVTAELVRQRSAAENLERANAQRFQNQVGGNLGLGAQGISAGASAEVFANQMENLKLKYNSVYAAQKLYERSLAELKQVELQEILTVEQHREALNKLEAEYLAFKNGTASANNMFVRGSQQAAMGLNGMGVAIQQAGYQVGDFLVQIQSGTNWMVAFGQQATQLVGVLPSMSVALGASVSTLTLWATGLGIAIPLVTALGAMWMRSSASGSTATEVVDLYTEAIKAASSEIEELNNKLLEMRYPDLSDAQRLLKVQLDEAKQKAEDLRREIETLDQGPNFRGKSIGLSQLNDDLTAATDKANELEKSYAEVSKKQAELAVGASELARFEERRRQGAEAILSVLRQQKAEQEALANAVMRAGQYYAKSRVEGEKLAEAAKWTGIEVAKLAYIKFGNLADALTYMEGIASAAKSAANYTALIGTTGQGGADAARSDMWGATYLEGQQLVSPVIGAGKASPTSSGGGGGGGSNRLDSLIQELQTEQETLDIWYQESQIALQSASDEELAILGGKYEAKLRLEQEYQDKLKSILGQEANYRLTEMGSMFGALADLAGVGGKKMLKVQATLSAAATTIAAYETAVKAAAEAKTIPGRIAAYAKFLAVGLGAVKAIQSAGGVGGGGGGGHSPGNSSVPSQTESASPQTVYIDSIDPGGLYSGQMLINLFDAFYNENDKRGKVFVVGR